MPPVNGKLIVFPLTHPPLPWRGEQRNEMPSGPLHLNTVTFVQKASAQAWLMGRHVLVKPLSPPRAGVGHRQHVDFRKHRIQTQKVSLRAQDLKMQVKLSACSPWCLGPRPSWSFPRDGPQLRQRESWLWLLAGVSLHMGTGLQANRTTWVGTLWAILMRGSVVCFTPLKNCLY